jgi:hypothetical protein
VLLAFSPAAWAQSERAEQAPAAGGTSNAFAQACTDLLNGRLPPGGTKAADSLRDACNGLMEARTQDERQAEQRAQARREAAAERESAVASGTGAEPGDDSARGQGSAAAQGSGVGASFAQAGHELVTNPLRASGLKRNGSTFGYTLITNPVGWFTGQGINAELFGTLRSLPKISWVGGAQYSRATATNGTVDMVGAEAGADYFLYGRNNEGLRIGPRMELAFGRETFQTATTFGWLGLSGEVGYNFIASNGITGALAAGFGGRISGHKQENFASMTGGEAGPYAKVGIGYSW